LLEQLGEQSSAVVVCASRGREHAALWARRVWEWAAGWPNDHVCILNDDVVLLPGFRERLAALVAAVPDEPISLHCTNPRVLPYAAQGHAWVRSYHYTGPAVVLPPGAAASLCEYTYSLPWSLLSRINEDCVAIHWAWERQRPFWYALPAPLTHDTAVPSTLGYDNHPHRTPTVLDGPLPDPTVRPEDRWRVPFVELDWMHSAKLDTVRHLLRAGHHLCQFCLVRPGELAREWAPDVKLCHQCLIEAFRSLPDEYHP
jgi:hypothetical protein